MIIANSSPTRNEVLIRSTLGRAWHATPLKETMLQGKTKQKLTLSFAFSFMVVFAINAVKIVQLFSAKSKKVLHLSKEIFQAVEKV